MSQNNGSSTSLRLKTGLAEMLKGGVIMDVTTVQQAAIDYALTLNGNWTSV